jgi:TonB-linked SusC/RagA family outer membrane protein
MRKIINVIRLLLFGLFLSVPILSAAQTKITGTVIDSTNTPIAGATVNVKETGAGAKTAVDGTFVIPVSQGQTLVISFVGYNAREIAVTNLTAPITITLQAGSSVLSDVVVVGYGTQKRVNISGAVSQVSGQALEDRPITNLGAGLQGLIPNLQISPMGGAPGQGSSFNVRGLTSLNGGSPLILVDGVVQDPNLINPNDVASVTVLKDAAAAAIYGGRAAYGVILITTKTGRKGQKPAINISSSYASNKMTVLPKYMNSLDYINYMDSASINAGSGAYFSDRIRKGVVAYFNDPVNNLPVLYDPATDNGYYQYVGNTDWSAELYRPGYQQQHNVSVTGGSNNVSYYLSYGLLDQRGFLASSNDKYQRQNFNISVNTDVVKWLTFSGKLRYTYGKEEHPGGGTGWSGISAYSGQLKGDLRPLMPVRHPDGNFSGQGSFTNPFAVGALGGSYRTKTNDLWLTGAAQIRPLTGLNVNLDYTFNPYSTNTDFSSTMFREYHADGSYNIYPWTNPNTARQTNSNNNYYAFNAYADYSRTLGDNHNFKLLVGYNQEQKFTDSFSAQRQNLVINDQPNLSLATGPQVVNQSASSWAVQGAFSRLNYDFDKKYFIELNTRIDGSSKFPKDRRSVVLPSASAAWRISQEKFWQDGLLNNIISELKLRGSYGVLGNQYVNSNFPYISNYGVITALGYMLGSTTTLPVGVSPGNLISPDFTWEKVYQWNVGLDAELLTNRLEMSVDVFTRSTKGMLVAGQPLPAVLGTAVPQSNAADLKTQGYEISLKWRDKIGKDISYYANAVFSDARATITKFDNPTKDLSNNNNYEGKKFGEIWGYAGDGLFQSADEISKHADQSQLFSGTWNPGDVKYRDLNGDGKITPGNNTLDSSGDQRVIGNTTPRYQYSLSTGVRWKSIDLDIILQGVGKRDYVPDGRYYGIGSEWDVPMQAASNFWSYANPNGFLPRPYINGGHGNRANNTRYLQSAAYLRLKQVTVGYALPVNWASKISVSQLRVYFTGQNILTFTKLSELYDPENLDVMGYPITKSYSFGINLTFK